MDIKNEAVEVCRLFNIEGKPVGFKVFTEGHINTTYFLEFKKDDKTFKYLVQGINTHVFKNPHNIMENIVNSFKQILKKLDWNYSYDEEKNIFTTNMQMKNAIGNITILIIIRELSYTIYAILSSHVESTFLHQVAEYLHRANYNLKNGNFELDYDSGEIRYKTYVNLDNINISESVIVDSFIIPIFMFERYGKNLMKLLITEGNPALLISEAENNVENNQ